MTDRSAILLDAAIELLRDGQVVTLDSVAKEVGLSKAGVVHHFPTKQALMLGVVDRVADGWEAALHAETGPDAGPIERLRIYVDYVLRTDFDGGDLALLADPHLRAELAARWAERLAPWTDTDTVSDPAGRARLQSARLIADGLWADSAIGLLTMTADERDRVRDLALGLIDAAVGR